MSSYGKSGIGKGTENRRIVRGLRSGLTQRSLYIQHGCLWVGAVERRNAAQIVSFYVVPESAAIALHGQGRRVLHVLEKHVEHVAYLVDELIEIIVERAIVRRNYRQLGIIFEEYETREMYDLELIQCHPDGIFFWRRRLDFFYSLIEDVEIFR